MSKHRWIIVLLGFIILLTWWFFPRKPLPLGYTGTAEHLREVPGERPTVEMPVSRPFLTSFEMSVDGHRMTNDQKEFTLPRNREVDIQGHLEINLGKNDEFVAAQIAIASQSNNAQGFLIEGEMMLHDGYQHVSGEPLIFDISKKWKVPDRKGEFFLLIVYHATDNSTLDVPRHFAVVCPVRLE